VEQTFESWELIILDDGATDETADVARRYQSEHPQRIRVISHSPSKGLRSCANIAINQAHGEYIMRLDADDYLCESALLALSAYLDRFPEIGLVYPNYIFVDERGEYLGLEHRKRIGKDAQLLDLPAHGACTMVRSRVLKSLGGYDEQSTAEDGYELWLKVLHRYPMANLVTPLFYYRQHSQSVSNDQQQLLSARETIKRRMAAQQQGAVAPRMVAVIPAKNTYEHLPNIALRPIAGRPLIDHTVEAALAFDGFSSILVSTDDPAVVDYCAERFPQLQTVLRPLELSQPDVQAARTLYHAVRHLEDELQVYADILVCLSVHCPLRRSNHIRKALDTLMLFNTDSVLGVYEDYELHLAHGPNGMEPINAGMLRRLRLEREALFVDNGSIRAIWRDVVSETDCFGSKVGHVVMPREESFQIKTEFDVWLVEQLLERES